MSYYIINYYTLRILLILLILVMIFLINIHLLKRKIKLKVEIIIYLIVCITVSVLPFESVFYKFKSPRQLFRYRNPISKIIKEYLYDDYAFIYSEDSNDDILQGYRLSDKGWVLEKKFELNTNNYKGYGIGIYKSSYKDIVGVFISGISDVDKEIKISDNLETNFDNFDYVNKFLGVENVAITRIAIITPIPEDYTLFIDDGEYRPF